MLILTASPSHNYIPNPSKSRIQKATAGCIDEWANRYIQNIYTDRNFYRMSKEKFIEMSMEMSIEMSTEIL